MPLHEFWPSWAFRQQGPGNQGRHSHGCLPPGRPWAQAIHGCPSNTGTQSLVAVTVESTVKRYMLTIRKRVGRFSEPWALLALGPLRAGHPYDFARGDATAGNLKGGVCTRPFPLYMSLTASALCTFQGPLHWQGPFALSGTQWTDECPLQFRVL